MHDAALRPGACNSCGTIRRRFVEGVAPLPVKSAQQRPNNWEDSRVGGMTTSTRPGTRVNGMKQVSDPKTNTWDTDADAKGRNHHFFRVVTANLLIGGRLGAGVSAPPATAI